VNDVAQAQGDLGDGTDLCRIGLKRYRPKCVYDQFCTCVFPTESVELLCVSDGYDTFVFDINYMIARICVGKG